MFKRILIANRGEIALRVIRACRELGIETVAIFSEADRGAQYLELADEAYCVGPARGAESYLKIDRVISAAEVGNVQAIHPGYGFLSENAHFNQVCRDCNIDFIGPTPEAMRRLGDKNEARRLAREAQVPTVPGSEGLIDDEKQAIAVAHQIGFPVLVKASAGGGGPMSVLYDEPGPRPRPPLATAACIWKNTSSIRGTWKCRLSPTITATPCISGSAIAPCSGGTRR